jgi:hypothetical protein
VLGVGECEWGGGVMGRKSCFWFCGCVFVLVLVLCVNGITRANAINVRKMASAGKTVRVIRCDKVVSRHANYTDYLVTAESLNGDNRVTVEVDINRSPLPQAGEVWRVDASGWWVVFTERVRGEK